MSALFITATGTDAGKTFITAGLLRHLRARGIAARGLKPVVSGFDAGAPEASDSALLLAAMGEAVTQASLDAVSPLRFAAPLAPNMAARREGRQLTLAGLLTPCAAAYATSQGPLLIEGVGGVMSPVTDEATCLDWIAALGLPSLLVSGTYLGALSHALSAAAVLAERGCPLAAIALNETPGSGVSLAETQAELARFLPGVPMVPVRRGAADFSALAQVLAQALGLAPA
jgi:dethiobiotin synthetase